MSTTKPTSRRLGRSGAVRLALTVAALALSLSPGAFADAAEGMTTPLPDGRSQATSVDWPQFHNTADRQGYNPNENTLNPGNVAKLGVKFKAVTTGEVWSSPAVVGGVIYVGSDDKKVWAFDANTGVKKWSYATGGLVRSSPAVVGGVVYVGSDDGNLYALNASTGTKNWSFQTGGDVAGASPAVSAGMVYIGSRGGDIWALNASTGAKVWNQHIWAIWGSPAVANGIVYVGSDQSKLFAFNATTGATIWSATVGGRIRHTPAVVGTTAYVGADDGKLYAFNANSGSLLWSVWPLGAGYDSILRAAPAVWNNTVYVTIAERAPEMNGYEFAYNATTGALKWEGFMADYATVSPTVAGGLVFAGSYDHQMYAWDAVTGEKLWASGFGPEPLGFHSSPAVVNGIVYAGNRNNKVYAWDLEDFTPPVLTLTGGYPSGYSKVNSVQFYMTSSEPDSTFECKLDDGVKAACSKPFVYSNLMDGDHTFTGWAVDKAGNESLPKSKTWVQDTVLPILTVTGGPNGNSATFYLSSSEPGVFWCNWDGNGYIACTSPATKSGLTSGTHTFSAFAADLANNHSATYSKSWKV